jgi:hypothetical protein
MDREATPVLDAVEGIDLKAYKDILIERFRKSERQGQAGPNLSGKFLQTADVLDSHDYRES